MTETNYFLIGVFFTFPCLSRMLIITGISGKFDVTAGKFDVKAEHFMLRQGNLNVIPGKYNDRNLVGVWTKTYFPPTNTILYILPMKQNVQVMSSRDKWFPQYEWSQDCCNAKSICQKTAVCYIYTIYD